MQREDIKSYKDACKCIGRKSRQYKDVHMNTYEQLTTIIAALNFIANKGKPWHHELHKCIKHWYIWHGSYWYDDANADLFGIGYDNGVGSSYANTSTQLRLKERDDAEYLKTNFTNLLFDWFRK